MTIADLNSLTRYLTNTTPSDAKLSAANLLILTNKYYEDIIGRIITETAASKWPHGDFNYTAFPSFTVSLTAGTQVYNLRDWGTSDEETIFTILGVEVLDNNSNYQVLDRITLDDIHALGSSQSEYRETNGLPTEYELRDNFILLYPAPAAANVTLADGLRIFHLRTADRYTAAEVTTGTKEPGFPSPWHDAISYGISADHWEANGEHGRADRFRNEYEKRIGLMLKFISNRDQAIHSRLEAITSEFR